MQSLSTIFLDSPGNRNLFDTWVFWVKGDDQEPLFTDFLPEFPQRKVSASLFNPVDQQISDHTRFPVNINFSKVKEVQRKPLPDSFQ